MNHAMTLADNLLLGDAYVNQRVQALSRLLDRILVLDEILPDKEPEKTIRFEYYYDNAVQEHPPWKGASTEEGYMRYAEDYLKQFKDDWDRMERMRNGTADISEFMYDGSDSDDDNFDI